MSRKWEELEALLLKSAYKLAEDLNGLREEPGPLAFTLKAAVEAAIFIFFLYTVSEVAASLWRVSEAFTTLIP